MILGVIHADVVVPCYNEEGVIVEFFEKLSSVLNSININWNIVFVNDGSTDGTAKSIQAFSPSNNIKAINLINLSKNYGHMIALREGLRNSIGDFTISLDCDLQDPPHFIADLVQEFLNDSKIYDCITGQRTRRESDSFFKRATAKFYYWLAKIFISPNIVADAADFRLITKNLRDEILKYTGSYPIYRILIPLSTNNIKVLNYVRDVRHHGKTHYNFRKMVNLASLSFFYFSNLPIVLLNFLVYSSTLFNLLVVAYIFQARFFQSTVPGWSSTVLVLSISMLLIITLINIFGRYTYNNFLVSQGLPLIVTKIESKGESNERY